MSKKSIILVGASGRMGQSIKALVEENPWNEKFEIACELSHENKKLTDVKNAVVIDFSQPESTLEWAKQWAERHCPVLICTTGFGREQHAELAALLKDNAWAWIPNTSLGIFQFIRSLTQAVRFFRDIESIKIHEIHHVHKKDAPSGTALLIKSALIASGYKNEIVVSSAREGEVVGVHTVLLQRKYDRLIFTHEAQDRKLFAEGALQLAEKLANKKARAKPYSFDELLGSPES